MKIKVYGMAFLTIVISALFFKCAADKRISLGYTDDICVLADSTFWEENEHFLREVFEKGLVTPQHETVFTLKKGNLSFFKNYNNIVFLASLDSDGPVSDFIKNSFSQEMKERVKHGDFLFTKKDEWAYNQYVMFLVSENKETLIKKIRENKSYLFNLFDNYWTKSLRATLYNIAEQEDIEKHLLEKYDWMVRVPYDYFIETEKPAQNFVMLKRSFPERWLFVHWINTYDPSVLEKDWCIAKRNELCEKFFKGDRVDEKFVLPVYEEVDFLGRRASKLSGLWENSITIEGGSFISYSFYDEDTQRIYMLDFAVFDPRHKSTKRSLLRHGEVVMHTFQTGLELDKAD